MRFARLYQKLYCEPLMLSLDAFTAFDAAFRAAAASVPTIRPVDHAATDAPSGEYLDNYRRGRATLEQIRVEEVLRKYGPVAVVQVHGAIDRNLSRMEVECYGSCDLQDINLALDECLADASIETVILDFDTPGGAVIGLAETAARIVRLGAGKNTVAAVFGQCCSAGYYLASQCHQIVIGEGACLGSIGVRCARLDMTAAMRNQGVSVTLVATSDEKTDFSPSKPMSPQEHARIQARVDSLYEDFCARVRAGRPGVSDEVMQAQVYFGQEAVDVGLADDVMPSLDVLAGECQATSQAYALKPGARSLDYSAKPAVRAEAASPFTADSGLFRAEFDESLHPRDEDGKFTHSGTFNVQVGGDLERHIQHGLALTDKVHGINDALSGLKTLVGTNTSNLKPNEEGGYFGQSGGRGEIHVRPNAKRPVLAAVHEAGHRLDHMAFGQHGFNSKGPLYATDTDTLAKLMSVIKSGKASGALSRAVIRSVGKNRKNDPFGPSLRQFNQPAERFARAYSQYVALRTGDPTLKKQIESHGKILVYGKMLYHTDEEFAKVAQAFDKVFAAHKLKK